jgi:hypothetical protein
MSKSAGVPSRHGAPFRERRKNKRLRVLVDELRGGIRANEQELSVQFTRLAQLQAELDIVKSGRRTSQPTARREE